MMNQPTILVADDETHVTHILSMKFGTMGYAVHVARDGEEALAMANELMPDLIVTDFQMPCLSGYEMAVRLKTNEATANIPLVMLTARGHKLSSEELAETNIVELMDKPFSVTALTRFVGSVLNNPIPMEPS